MKGKKYIIFIVIIVAILALLLVRGFWKQGSGEAQRGNSAVVQLGEDVSSKTAAESVQDVLEQTDESSQETSEEEATSEAEEASSEEVEYDTETLTVSTDKPSKAPEKSSVSVNVTKPTTTPTPESSQQPTTTPTPESSQQPTTTPTPESSQQPTTTPTPESSQQPTTTPTPESSQQPTTTPEPESSQQPTTTPEPESSQQPTTTPEPESSQQPTTTPEPDSGQDTTTPSEPDSTPEASEPSEEPKLELVQEGEYDLRVIPDKYNTGCSNEENMLKINSAVTVGGVEYSIGDNGDTVVIDLVYRNQDIADEVVIKNVDFSGKKFAIRHSPQTAKKFTFENCKFDEVATTIGKDVVSVVFTNCSFRRFYGSNSTFYNCTFGGSVTDGMNPYSDVHVYNSYFSDFNYDNPTGVHTDAIHIYGKDGVDAENISFHNCRIEIPSIQNGKNDKINACFMVALEYSNAKNLLFENCFINGGGYSIYALANPGFSVDNVKFSNVSVGGAKLYGKVYPILDEKVVLNDVKDTSGIYVASVWKDEAGKVHLSATNDTAQDRYLVVETPSGRQEFMLPCKKTVEQSYTDNNGRAPYFSELSIDVEVIPEATNPDWIICYDKYGDTEKQIRFVNWSGEDVYR